MSDAEDDITPPHRLKFWQRLCYGVGHVLNDLCASMWFSYLLVFFHKILQFSNELSGYVMLLGQVADALCTPFIGIESDRTKGIRGYGKRKTWHLIGTISVATSFPFLFMVCLGCSHAADWAQFIYYAPFVVIFQFGWAATQIAHLAMIPELSPNDDERVELNAIRYAFTVLANITVFAVAWLLLQHGDPGKNLGPQDAPLFRTLAFSILGTGLLFTIAFHIGTKEHVSAEEQDGRPILNEQGSSSTSLTLLDKTNMTWRKWLKEPQFYQVAVIYMCTRLIVNVTQTYMPMYLTDSLHLEKHFIAVIPLVVYISGFLISILMKFVNKLIGRKMTYVVGLIVVLGACATMWFMPDKSLYVIAAAFLLGAGGSTVLVTSLAMTADLIGQNTKSSAFVYGAMSFTDKLSNGLAVTMIQNLHPCTTDTGCCPACVWYYRGIMVIFTSITSIVALLTLLSLWPQKLGALNAQKNLRRTLSIAVNAENEPLLSAESMVNNNAVFSSPPTESGGPNYGIGPSRASVGHAVLQECSANRNTGYGAVNSNDAFLKPHGL